MGSYFIKICIPPRAVNITLLFELIASMNLQKLSIVAVLCVLFSSSAHALQFRKEKHEFTIGSGRILRASLLIPHQPRDAKILQKFPVFLVFGGFQNAARVLEVFQPNVPAIVASFDYPFDPPRKFEFPRILRFAPQARQAIDDTLAGINELKRILKSRADVNPEQISIAGASFGAPFAIAAAALDHEISGVVVIHGFGDVVGTAQSHLARKWKESLGILANPTAWLVSNLVGHYLNLPELEKFASKLCSRQRVLMISAEADRMIPSWSNAALWNSLQASSARVERIITPGDHIRHGSPELISGITAHVAAWMKANRLR